MKLKFILITIIAIAFVLRVYALNIIPIGFTPDEASFGYDAFSILKTGMDQWGNALPIVLESFGDFKMPLYSYITIPSVIMFGLTKFAVRLPNALLGTAAVFVTYLLVKELLDRGLKIGRLNKKVPDTIFSENTFIALLSGLLLAVSPWHVMMSRGAFEANLTTFILPLAIYLFIKGLEDKKLMISSSIFFGLNLFSYHSARLVTPLLVLVLMCIYRNKLRSENETLVKTIFRFRVSLIIFLTFLSAAIFSIYLGGANRVKDITIFSGALNEASDERFVAMYQGVSEFNARLFHNKYQVIGKRFISNYSQYFSANILFFNGPAEGTYGMVPGRGVIYLFELPLLIGFLYSLFITKDKKPLILILIWLLIAPIPAALTQGRGFAGNRSVIMLPALTIMSAIGFYELYRLQISRLNKLLFSVSIFGYLLICLLSFLAFLENYFILSPYKTSKDMLYGNLEVASWLTKNQSDKKKVIVSKSLSEPHIYIAFANRWNPADYQEESKNWREYSNKGLSFLDQLDGYKLGKYSFGTVDYNKHLTDGGILLVGKPDEFPSDVKPVAKFMYPDGGVSVIVVEPFKQAYASNIK